MGHNTTSESKVQSKIRYGCQAVACVAGDFVLRARKEQRSCESAGERAPSHSPCSIAARHCPPPNITAS